MQTGLLGSEQPDSSCPASVSEAETLFKAHNKSKQRQQVCQGCHTWLVTGRNHCFKVPQCLQFWLMLESVIPSSPLSFSHASFPYFASYNRGVLRHALCPWPGVDSASTEDPALPVRRFQELTWFPGGGTDGGAAGPWAGAALGPDGNQVDGAGLQARQPSREVENLQRLGVAPLRTARPEQNLEPAHRSSQSVWTAAHAPTVPQLYPVAPKGRRGSEPLPSDCCC